MGIGGKNNTQNISTHMRGIYGNSTAVKREPGLHPAPKQQILDAQAPAEAATTCPPNMCFPSGPESEKHTLMPREHPYTNTECMGGEHKINIAQPAFSL